MLLYRALKRRKLDLTQRTTSTTDSPLLHQQRLASSTLSTSVQLRTVVGIRIYSSVQSRRGTGTNRRDGERRKLVETLRGTTALQRPSRQGSTRSFSSSNRISNSRSEPAPPPLNEVQVPLISPNLRSQLFPPPSSPFAPLPPTPQAIEISRSHLQSHGLLPTSECPSKPLKKLEPAIDFKLPRLQGPTISHHFHSIGSNVAEPYLSLARSFLEEKIPPRPEIDRWELSSGWSHYHSDGSWEPVDYPPQEEDKTMVFDVETLPFRGGVWPVMAVAVGRTGWYGWVSPWLTGEDDEPNHLIPFGPTKTENSTVKTGSTLFEEDSTIPRLLIGHNVLYDRARVKDEYELRRPGTRYIDTLSLHVAVSGLTNPQRPSWIKYRKSLDAEEALKGIEEEEEETSPLEAKMKAKKKSSRKNKEEEEEETIDSTTKTTKPKPKTWKEVSSLNSLSEVARLHCGYKPDKTLRSVFIDPSTTLLDVRQNFAELIDYCARDVQTTLDVYRALLPKFLESCPHPATFAGVVLMSQPILPVNYQWPRYLERAEETYQTRLEAVQKSLNELAEEARKRFDEAKPNDEGRYEWEEDVWLKQLDWTPKRARRLPDDEPSKRRSKSQLEKAVKEAQVEETAVESTTRGEPRWTNQIDKLSLQHPLTPILFETTYRSHPVVYSHSLGWLFAVPSASNSKRFVALDGENPINLDELDSMKDQLVKEIAEGKPKVTLYTIPPKKGSSKFVTLVSTLNLKKVKDGVFDSPYPELEEAMSIRKKDEGGEVHEKVMDKLRELAEKAKGSNKTERKKSFFLRQLDWEHVDVQPFLSPSSPSNSSSSSSRAYKYSDLIWPKWYWDLDVPGHGLDVSIGKRAAPLLLRLRWKGFPLAHSKQHGWCYRIPRTELDSALESDPTLSPLSFSDVADMHLREDESGAYVQLPHPDGEGKNVGSPLSKPFVAAFEDGILTSEFPAAEAALALNASCSYWTSARERILNQMVVWEGNAKTPPPTRSNLLSKHASESTQGLILPQVIPMGTITRRAVERTWLTASNAKKNRVGSELKSMVQAPPGYAIVGADVDSEELWICSVMGDAQFGIHGATAIGWMTLEGTKSAGTDLHSKSASILGISRDDAKVFNYSRIYGAGVKHAVQLLIKSNPTLSTEQATQLAKNLYASTKGVVDRSAAFKRNFWHGGTESFVFNKLEEIAQNERPRTPALGCGLTAALTKAYLPAEGKSKAGEGYLPSRINWVVQSSGVDYLHLLLVSMEYLTKRFEIDARYLISVHDEIRYLVNEEDKYRAAMALQIANLWTRSLFAYRLQMPDLPQGCAFFSAVDVDTCFRKEVNMTCVTPSNPDPIPFGESQDISDTLSHTSGGSLFQDGRDMSSESSVPSLPVPELDAETVVGGQHRVEQIEFLNAQTEEKPKEILKLWKLAIENARKLPLVRSKGKVDTNNLGAVVDQPLKKIRSIRFEGEEEELYPRGAPTPLRRRRSPSSSRSTSASSTKKKTNDDEDGSVEFDEMDEIPEDLEGDENFSVHRPLSRMHV
ncbi:DNA-directed DNA polymerase gamma MIP1 [Sporobolomyces salmoneus]|uniref:DNA-directed DNA polymerase gamma MIP1 n=1 Tax=Sporobolomyces salmoneus TaxID=183962 RepID=UPI00317B5D90